MLNQSGNRGSEIPSGASSRPDSFSTTCTITCWLGRKGPPTRCSNAWRSSAGISLTFRVMVSMLILYLALPTPGKMCNVESADLRPVPRATLPVRPRPWRTWCPAWLPRTALQNCSLPELRRLVPAYGATTGRRTNNFRICVACLKASRLGMYAADMPSLEGLRHATLAETRKLFIVRSYRAFAFGRTPC